LTSPEIHTARLILDPLTVSDAEALVAYRSRPEVCRFQNWEPSRLEDAVDFLARLCGVGFDTPGTWFQLAVRLRESGLLVGDLGVHFLEDGAQVEIGFTLAPEAQGRGLGIEAVTGLVDYLFRTLGKHRVFASVDPRNEASVRLLRRSGMRQEAHFVKSLAFKGEWADDLVFAILKSEWDAREKPG
jgi:RimJ/RimL family protein N-acetyltransferase